MQSSELDSGKSETSLIEIANQNEMGVIANYMKSMDAAVLRASCQYCYVTMRVPITCTEIKFTKLCTPKARKEWSLNGT